MNGGPLRPCNHRNRHGDHGALMGWLKLNEYLQSVTNPAVYAAGDAAQEGTAPDSRLQPRRQGCRR